MNFKIPFSGRSQKYNDKEIQAILSVVNNDDGLTQGKMRNLFEEKFANYLGVKNCFAVCNATAALEMAAQLCQFEEGDEFIAPSHTFTSSVYPFIKKGGRLVWADIDFSTRVMGLTQLKEKVTPRTKAVVFPHLYGYLGEIVEISKFCKDRNILLIEDAAQSIGTSVAGKKSGSFGDLSVFSFHSHKNISTLGEGGMLVVNNKAMAEIVPMLRHNGHCLFEFERPNYWTPAMGNVDLPELNGHYLLPNNYCLGEVECALGVELLDRLENINSFKRARAIRFIDALSKYSFLQFLREDSNRHNYHLLVAYVEGEVRDQLLEFLSREKGIQCVVQYYPLNRYDFYKKLGYGEASCPYTDKFFDNMISFPFHHWLADDDFDYILNSTIEACETI